MPGRVTTVKTNRLLLFATLLLLLNACASGIQAVTDHDSNFDFSGVRSIAILPVDRRAIPVTSVSDMEVSRLEDALGAELVNRGYEIVSDANAADADLLLSWHFVTEEKTDVRTYNTMSARYRNCWSCPPGWGGTQQQVSVRQFTQGTFIVDLLDPDPMQSVWRAVIEGRLRDLNAEERASRRTEAAQAIFASFPPQ